MTNQTVGAFLCSKAKNMRHWLLEELGTAISGLTMPITELGATTMAAKLLPYRNIITERDWEGLVQAAAEEQVMMLPQVISAVRTREDLHDKFWRYLELFADTIGDPQFSQ